MKPFGSLFDVYFLTKPPPRQKGDDYELICSFKEGYAAFIAPLFESVNDEAGRDIVFINGATFSGRDLKLLSKITSTARKQMVAKEESWDVFCGYTMVKEGRVTRKRDSYSKVTKYKMNLLLDQVDAAIARAKSAGAYVSFNFWGGGG